MLLFLTRDAFLRFSIDDRLAGGIEPCGLVFSQTGELGSRPCQNTLGELALLDGEDLIGEASALDKLFF